MKNYLVYPFKVMNISQWYSGSYSHSPHNEGASPYDYPIDECCEDSGRSWFYCPCDEMKIVRIYGVGNSGANTLWLQSVKKVYFADGSKHICTIMLTHPMDDDLKALKVGQKFKRGEKICREGTDGNATGNHIHLSVGYGKYKYGWVQNSKGKWVLSVTGKPMKPEKAFYVDKSFTKIKNGNAFGWKSLPEYSTTSEKEVTKAGVRQGQKIKIKQGAVDSVQGWKFCDWVYTETFDVISVSDDTVKFGINKAVTGWVNINNCEVVK